MCYDVSIRKEVVAVDIDLGEFLRNFLAIASFFVTLLEFMSKNRDSDKKPKKRKRRRKKKPARSSGEGA